MLLPVIYIKGRKFSLLFSLGSLFVLAALSMLRGPAAFFYHLIAKERLPLTVAYIAALVLTLYCAMGLRRTLPTVIAATLQVHGSQSSGSLVYLHQS